MRERLHGSPQLTLWLYECIISHLFWKWLFNDIVNRLLIGVLLRLNPQRLYPIISFKYILFSSITNKMQRYTIHLFLQNAV
jgi:hypothetical protein